MRRRSMLKAALAGLAGTLALGSKGALAGNGKAEPPPPTAGPAAPAIARGQRELTLLMAWARATPGLAVAAERFAAMVARLTDHRLTVKVFDAGDLVSATDILDAIGKGTADLGHGSSYFWALRHPAFHFFTGVPFGLTAQEMAAWLYQGGGQSLWEELYRPLNVQPFFAGSTGTQPTGWFRREVPSVADIKGLRIRIAGLGAEVFKRLGAIPMMMPAAEMGALLTHGGLDAVEWVGPWSDEATGLPRLARYCYLPGVIEPGPAVEIIVNRKLFTELGREQQAALRSAAAATATETLAEFTYNNAITLPRLIKDGAELRRFDGETVKALARVSKEVVDELAASDALAKRIHASYTTFWQACRTYAPVAEGGFVEARHFAFS